MAKKDRYHDSFLKESSIKYLQKHIFTLNLIYNNLFN